MSKVKRSATLRVQYALDHHAAPLKPIAQALQTALDGAGILHAFRHWSTGNNSNYIQLVDRRIYIRGIIRPVPGIEVLDKCRGRAVFKICNERDAVRWVATL